MRISDWSSDVCFSDLLTLLGRVDGRVTGPTWFSAVQDNDVPSYFGIANFRNSQRDTFPTVNARLGIQRGDISLNASVDNLFDAKYSTDSAVTPEFGCNFMSPGDRRSYGRSEVRRVVTESVRSCRVACAPSLHTKNNH